MARPSWGAMGPMRLGPIPSGRRESLPPSRLTCRLPCEVGRGREPHPATREDRAKAERLRALTP
eukprot:1573162-Alexandrium_andersonii.AAC.1